MLRITHASQPYPWGSPTAIPSLLGLPEQGILAEAWWGAHRAAPSTTLDGSTLRAVIEADPHGTLGDDIVARFGPELPYLLKAIAADHPLSLQVHPNLARARAGCAAEDAAGIPRGAAHRNYRDANHKPELIYALTTFQALCGFRSPRRASQLLQGLAAPLAVELAEMLRRELNPRGIETAFRHLLDQASRPRPEDVAAVAAACARRLQTGSPSPSADRTVELLQEEYPGDPGVVTSLLLNCVTLEPGEAMFVPAGGVHAYVHGLGIELMANSDNVLRAGLTPKHVDVAELLANVDYVAAPPIRVAPELFHGATRIFSAPVDDFELSVTTVADDRSHPLPGSGPRVVVCLDGELLLDAACGSSMNVRRGEAVFVPASDGVLSVRGAGLLVQADAP